MCYLFSKKLHRLTEVFTFHLGQNTERVGNIWKCKSPCSVCGFPWRYLQPSQTLISLCVNLKVFSLMSNHMLPESPLRCLMTEHIGDWDGESMNRLWLGGFISFYSSRLVLCCFLPDIVLQDLLPHQNVRRCSSLFTDIFQRRPRCSNLHVYFYMLTTAYACESLLRDVLLLVKSTQCQFNARCW